MELSRSHLGELLKALEWSGRHLALQNELVLSAPVAYYNEHNLMLNTFPFESPLKRYFGRVWSGLGSVLEVV